MLTRGPTVMIRCELVMREPDAQPPVVEARFCDWLGRVVRIIDKEPIFADIEGSTEGVVAGTEVSRRPAGAELVVRVSLGTPWSLETTDGASEVEVWARDIVESEG